MANLESRKHISPDSGYPITLHPHFNTKINSHIPPDPVHEERIPAADRALSADPKLHALLSTASRTDLTESIGTLLSNVQLSTLSTTQLDELALLVSDRGVVFFRDQDLTTEQQVKLFEHYGELDKHPAQKGQQHVNIGASNDDFRDILNYTPWPQGDWHADTSFEINPPSYSLLRMEEAPDVGGDTQWVCSLKITTQNCTDKLRYRNTDFMMHSALISGDSLKVYTQSTPPDYSVRHAIDPTSFLWFPD